MRVISPRNIAEGTVQLSGTDCLYLMYTALRNLDSVWIQDVQKETLDGKPQIILTLAENEDNVLFSITEHGIERLGNERDFIH